MTLLSFGYFLGLDISVKDTSPEVGNSVSRVLPFRLLHGHEFMMHEFTESVACIAPGEIRVVSDISGSEFKTAVEYPQDGHVCGFHPLDLPVHTFPVDRNCLYTTGLYGFPHDFGLHILRYRELPISSWGMDMRLDHALGSQTESSEENNSDSWAKQEPSAWTQPRMENNGLTPLKPRRGTFTAQRRHERCTALDWYPGRCERSGLTTTNHAHTAEQSSASAGGGRCVVS